MRNVRALLLFSSLPLLITLPETAPSEQPGAIREADACVLASIGLTPDSKALFTYFQSRTLTESSSREIVQLVRQLGDEDFRQREQASRALSLRGPAALTALRGAVEDTDAERARRAQECLDHIEKGMGPLVPGAAARVLALRRSVGAVPVLLNFLPFA